MFEGESRPLVSSRSLVKRRVDRRKCLLVIVLLFLIAAALATAIIRNIMLGHHDHAAKTARILIDCHPDKDPSSSKCTERGCTWVDRDDGDKRPKCTFPEDHGYRMVADPEDVVNGVKVTLSRMDTPAMFGMQPYENLTVLLEFHTDHRLRVKIYPEGVERFEIPEEALSIPAPSQPASNVTRLYDVTFTTQPFGFAVIRRSTNVTIFNSSVPGLCYYPQFLQLSATLPNTYVYGFGEHRHQTFRHDMDYRTWSIFARDTGPYSDWNLYGSHPVYMNVEDDGQANMVFLKNSNAIEVSLQPDPSLTFRTIGGVLDLYVFLGHSPGHAVSLYTQAIGRPVLPPYWALGFHLSRWGYTNISDMQAVVDRNRAAGIPYDVQWTDVDSLFETHIFTYDRRNWKGLPDLVNDLHNHHQKFVVIVDPGVGANTTVGVAAAINSPGYDMFAEGQADDVFVKDANGSTLLGKVWPGITAYPDFTIQNSSRLEDWFLRYVNFYRHNESVKVDSLWMDMNEPTNFVPGSVNGCARTTWDFPPYVPNIPKAQPDGKMFDKTLCMSSQQAWGRHYDVHSLYGHAMAMTLNKVLRRVFPGKRPWTMTRSSFAGTGHHASKWTGDNQSTWPAMHDSIISIMEFGMFGFAFNGADICGFWYDTTYEMCVRWHQLGAFYPFARNHNGGGKPPIVSKTGHINIQNLNMHQDPAAFDQRFVDVVKRPLLTRYRLLPYLYTLLYRAHLHGHTVLTPLLFQFPTDLKARDVDRQFMWGPALLISPVLEENATSVVAYFPQSRWFEYGTGHELRSGGEVHTLDTPLEKFNLHVRGGHVVPWQTPALTTYESRQNSLGVIVALDSAWRARGEQYLDDGESLVTNTSYSHISFEMDKAGELHFRPDKTDYAVGSSPVFDTVEIYGLPSLPQSVHVNGVQHEARDVRQVDKIVQILNLKLPVLSRHNISWTLP